MYLRITKPMESSPWNIFIGMVVDRFIFRNNKIMFSPCFISIPKTGGTTYKRGDGFHGALLIVKKKPNNPHMTLFLPQKKPPLLQRNFGMFFFVHCPACFPHSARICKSVRTNNGNINHAASWVDGRRSPCRSFVKAKHFIYDARAARSPNETNELA